MDRKGTTVVFYHSEKEVFRGPAEVVASRIITEITEDFVADSFVLFRDGKQAASGLLPAAIRASEGDTVTLLDLSLDLS